MPKRLIGTFYGEQIPSRIFEVRQGLDLLPRLDMTPGWLTSSGTYLAVAPDGSGAIQAISTSSGVNFRYVNDPINFGDFMTPLATFSGYVYAVAISDTYYAVGGASPFLYIFDRATHALQVASTAGLGAIYAMDFSPDGTLFAIAHVTSPYVRIYKTADWSYINVATPAGSTPGGCCFSKDGRKLLVGSYNSPYLSVFDPDNGASIYTNTFSAYRMDRTSGGTRMVRSPGDDALILTSLYNSPSLAQFDTSTNTPTLFTAMTPAIGSAGGVWVDPDPEEDALYLNHGAGSTNPTRTISKWRISTRSPYENQSTIFRNMMWGYSSPYSSAAIIATTPHRLTGTVRDVNNLPVARTVRAYRRSNGELMAQTVSDPVTGNYLLKLYDAGPYDVQFLTEGDELLNDLTFARSEPEPI